MPRISVNIHLTAGSAVARTHVTGHSFLARPRRTDGWPIGLGDVTAARTVGGAALEALVLMTEPALPGTVEAWPIGVLHLAGTREMLTCVAEADPFLSLVDLGERGDWHAQPEMWLRALRTMRPGAPRHPEWFGDHQEAELVLAQTRYRYGPAQQPAARQGRPAT